LSACIAVPIELGDEEPFNNEQLAFIEIGKTTKEEIAAAMSEYAVERAEDETSVELTPRKFRDGNWWLYVRTRKEAKWFYVLSGYYGGEAGTTGDIDYRFLLIKFHNNGIVAGYELSSSEGYGCNRSGICVRESRYMLLAPEDEDRVVKQFDIPEDRCGVYVYGKPKPESPILSSIPIRFDGHRIGWLSDKKQFFFLQLDQGAHQLATHSPNLLDQRPIEFSCAPGGLYFFELMPKRSGDFRSRSFWIEIEQRDAVKGRKAIRKRHLTLNITEPSD
jgi:hypothetical protein